MPRNEICFACARAKVASVRASSLQPPHHEPQMFTNTGLPANAFSASGAPVKTSRPVSGGRFALAPAAEEAIASAPNKTIHRTAMSLSLARIGKAQMRLLEGGPMGQLVADYLLERLREWDV